MQDLALGEEIGVVREMGSVPQTAAITGIDRFLARDRVYHIYVRISSGGLPDITEPLHQRGLNDSAVHTPACGSWHLMPRTPPPLASTTSKLVSTPRRCLSRSSSPCPWANSPSARSRSVLSSLRSGSCTSRSWRSTNSAGGFSNASRNCWATPPEPCCQR